MAKPILIYRHLPYAFFCRANLIMGALLLSVSVPASIIDEQFFRKPNQMADYDLSILAPAFWAMVSYIIVSIAFWMGHKLSRVIEKLIATWALFAFLEALTVFTTVMKIPSYSSSIIAFTSISSFAFALGGALPALLVMIVTYSLLGTYLIGPTVSPNELTMASNDKSDRIGEVNSISEKFSQKPVNVFIFFLLRSLLMSMLVLAIIMLGEYIWGDLIHHANEVRGASTARIIFMTPVFIIMAVFVTSLFAIVTSAGLAAIAIKLFKEIPLWYLFIVAPAVALAGFWQRHLLSPHIEEGRTIPAFVFGLVQIIPFIILRWWMMKSNKRQ